MRLHRLFAAPWDFAPSKRKTWSPRYRSIQIYDPRTALTLDTGFENTAFVWISWHVGFYFFEYIQSTHFFCFAVNSKNFDITLLVHYVSWWRSHAAIGLHCEDRCLNIRPAVTAHFHHNLLYVREGCFLPSCTWGNARKYTSCPNFVHILPGTVNCTKFQSHIYQI